MHCHVDPSPAQAAMPVYLPEIIAAPESAAAWYVAYTEPRKESLAAKNLQQQGFLTYLPLYKTMAKHASTSPETGTRVKHEPMFPRYMFFRPSNDKQSIGAARSTRGVNSIVRFGINFALIQPEILAAVQQHEQQRNRADLQIISPLQAGCRVRLCDPVLNGLEGLVHSTSAQRVIVLMEILGRTIKVSSTRSRVELT